MLAMPLLALVPTSRARGQLSRRDKVCPGSHFGIPRRESVAWEAHRGRRVLTRPEAPVPFVPFISHVFLPRVGIEKVQNLAGSALNLPENQVLPGPVM